MELSSYRHSRTDLARVSGATTWDRTKHLTHTKGAFGQLNFGGRRLEEDLVLSEGLEPSTSDVRSRRSAN